MELNECSFTILFQLCSAYFRLDSHYSSIWKLSIASSPEAAAILASYLAFIILLCKLMVQHRSNLSLNDVYMMAVLLQWTVFGAIDDDDDDFAKLKL